MATNVIRRSFSRHGDSGDGSSDAPGSSCDRNAEANGSEILRIRIYVYLIYSPCYIDTSLYARSQLTYQPITGISRGLVPVHLQDLQLQLAECLGPFRIPFRQRRATSSRTPPALILQWQCRSAPQEIEANMSP